MRLLARNLTPTTIFNLQLSQQLQPLCSMQTQPRRNKFNNQIHKITRQLKVQASHHSTLARNNLLLPRARLSCNNLRHSWIITMHISRSLLEIWIKLHKWQPCLWVSSIRIYRRNLVRLCRTLLSLPCLKIMPWLSIQINLTWCRWVWVLCQCLRQMQWSLGTDLVTTNKRQVPFWITTVESNLETYLLATNLNSCNIILYLSIMDR